MSRIDSAPHRPVLPGRPRHGQDHQRPTDSPDTASGTRAPAASGAAHGLRQLDRGGGEHAQAQQHRAAHLGDRRLRDEPGGHHRRRGGGQRHPCRRHPPGPRPGRPVPSRPRQGQRPGARVGEVHGGEQHDGLADAERRGLGPGRRTTSRPPRRRRRPPAGPAPQPARTAPRRPSAPGRAPATAGPEPRPRPSRLPPLRPRRWRRRPGPTAATGRRTTRAAPGPRPPPPRGRRAGSRASPACPHVAPNRAAERSGVRSCRNPTRTNMVRAGAALGPPGVDTGPYDPCHGGDRGRAAR